MLDNYEQLSNGVIKQKSFFVKKREYNLDYIKKRYDSYGEASIRMSFLRLGFIKGVISTELHKILDVGYGNGDFLSYSEGAFEDRCGFDINSYPIPKGCRFVDDIYLESFDLVCFFDALEHLDDIYDIQKLKTKYICVSVPECHYLSDHWFENWKHRRPDEHLWHFNEESLTNFMRELSYNLLASSHVEDIIRKSPEPNNILTCIFEKDERS